MSVKQHLIFFLVFLVFIDSASIKADEFTRIDSINQILENQKGVDRVKSLLLLSEAYRFVSYDKSIKAGLDALSYADDNNLFELKAELYKSLATSAQQSGDYALALDYYKKSMKVFEKTGSLIEIALLNNSIGHQYFLSSDYDSAIVYFDKALYLGEQIGDNSIKMTVAHNIGNIYYETGEFHKAMESYYLAQLLAAELKEETIYAKAVMNIGMIYWQWNENDKAISELRKAIEVFERTDFKETLSQAYNNLGLIFLYDKNEPDTASVYFQKSLEIREAIGSPVLIANVLVNMALVFSSKDNIEKAEHFYQRALQIYEISGSVQGIVRVYYHLGENHHNLKNYELSNEYLEKCMVKASEHGIDQYYSIVNDLFLKNYEALGDFQSFLVHYRNFKTDHDTLSDQYNLVQSREAQLKIRNIELLQQVSQLSEQNDAQQKKLVFYTYLLFSLLGLFFLGLIFYFILDRFRSLRLKSVSDDSGPMIAFEKNS